VYDVFSTHKEQQRSDVRDRVVAYAGRHVRSPIESVV
jgi:hypothetical protein